MAMYGNIHGLDAISGVTATASIDLGARRYFNGEEYVYCYNNTGSSVTAGALMVASGISGYSFTRSSTAAADLPMVAVKHTAVPAANYFWGLVRGSLYVLTSATYAKGTVLGIGADGVVQTHLVGSFPTGVAIGKALEAGSGSTAFLAHVRLFG